MHRLTWLGRLGAGLLAAILLSSCGGFFPSANTIVSISLSPASAIILPGNTQQFTATGTLGNNTVSNVSSHVTWTSSAPNIATIDSSGLATAVALGTTTITATSGNLAVRRSAPAIHRDSHFLRWLDWKRHDDFSLELEQHFGSDHQRRWAGNSGVHRKHHHWRIRRGRRRHHVAHRDPVARLQPNIASSTRSERKCDRVHEWTSEPKYPKDKGFISPFDIVKSILACFT